MIAANHLQEAPSGKPWERDWIRDWEPAPFNRADYDEWAVERHSVIEGRVAMVRDAVASLDTVGDPLLSTVRRVGSPGRNPT